MMKEPDQNRIFNDWLDAHCGLIFKVVRAYAFNVQDQEDLSQDIATKVWLSIPNFRGDSAVTTWLYRVRLFTAISWSRKETRHRDTTRPMENIERTLIDSAPQDSRVDWLNDSRPAPTRGRASRPQNPIRS